MGATAWFMRRVRWEGKENNIEGGRYELVCFIYGRGFNSMVEIRGLPWWLREESACNAGDPDSIPGLVASWQKWDSCTIRPLSDSTHHGWFCSQSFYKCWQQSFIFKHQEQRPCMCSAVVSTVPEADLFLAGGERRPQLQEYCRPMVARLIKWLS